jgi:RimJ/RimL family protein N-acetyltransferase
VLEQIAQIEFPAPSRIRRLEPEDRERISDAADAWWDRPMAGLLPLPFFTEFCDTSFVVERDGRVVAFLIGFLSQSARDEAYVHAVAVSPDARRQGLARLLYRRFAETVMSRGRRRIRAVTRPSNTGSIAFHRRLGFRVEPPAGFADGRAQLVLELPRPHWVDLGTANASLTAAALGAPGEGTLISLEPLAVSHGRDLAAAAADGDWSMTWMDASTPSAFERWLDSMLAAMGNGNPCDPRATFAVIRRSSGRAIGSTSFHSIHPEHRRVEIGMTWYARSEWRSGANVEAKLLMLGRAFALGFRRVEFKTDARNERSRRALEALPAQFEGVLRKHMVVRDGERRDCAYYSVIDDDWPHVRGNLERRLAAHMP